MFATHWTIATSRNGETIWINLAQVRAIVREQDETRIHFADGVDFAVRETPAELLRTGYLGQDALSALSGAMSYNS
jgi:hypothetical protein